MNSTIVDGSLVVLIWSVAGARRSRVASLVGATLVVAAVAASRVALEVHSFSGVVAGMVLGAAFVLASRAAFSVWRHEGGLRAGDVDRTPRIRTVAVPRHETAGCVQGMQIAEPIDESPRRRPPPRRDCRPAPSGRGATGHSTRLVIER